MPVSGERVYPLPDEQHPEWQFDFEVGFYFPEAYNPSSVGGVLNGVLPWLAAERMRAQFLDIRPEQAVYERIVEGGSKEVTLEFARTGQVDFVSHLHKQYLKGIHAVYRLDRRPVWISVNVDIENTFTVVVHIATDWREQEPSWAAAFETLGGLEPFLNAFSQVDSLWAGMDVEMHGPALGALLYGEILPDFGYYGSRLVAIVGKENLSAALEGCPRLAWLPSGGVFLCWPWETRDVYSTREYNRFQEYCSKFEEQLLRDIWRKHRAEPRKWSPKRITSGRV